MDLTRVKAKEALDVAPDGVTVERYAKDAVFDVPADLAVSLLAAEKVEEADGAELTAPQVAAGSTVIVPASATSVERTEVSPELSARMTEARTVTDAPPARTEIDPVEHGGETIDRMLTRGGDADAIAVENADPVAAVGKVSAGQQIVDTTDGLEPGETPAAEIGGTTPAEAEDGKSAGASPENKSVRRSSKKT